MDDSCIMDDSNLEILLINLEKEVNKLNGIMVKNPANRKVVNELVFSYKMLLSSMEIAENRDMDISYINKESLKKVKDNLIRFDILTEKEYRESGKLGGRRI